MPQYAFGSTALSALDDMGHSDGTPSSAPLTPDSEEDEEDSAKPLETADTFGGYEMKTLGKDLRRSEQEGDAKHEENNEEEKHFLPKGSSEVRNRVDTFTSREESAVIRGFDRRLVLFVALLYMLSFLDRSNIGNARIAGLERDLNLTSSQYEWLLTAFYITYIVFEWMTLIYRVVPPHIYISLCVLSWGVIASLQSLSTSFSSLLIMRALLGIGEAAFGPGVPFYLSFFFRRNELAFRTGLFISAAPLATSFASSLAWLITWLGKDGPIAPWRLLFLVEGFPSMIVGVWAWNIIPDDPGSAKFLTRRQKKVAVLRLRNNGRSSRSHCPSKTSGGGGLVYKELLSTLIDPTCYLTALMFFSCNVSFSSMPVFLPTILHEMGHTPLASQALSAPPYLLSFLIVLLTAHLSDKHQARSSYIILHAVLGAAGYLILALSGYYRWPTTIRYLAIYPATAGFFSAITVIITWTLNNQESESGRGAGMAVLNVIGQCGPLLGTRLYPKSDGPFYVRGMFVCAGFMGLVAVLALGLRLALSRLNARRLREWKGVRDVNGRILLHDEEEDEPFLFML